MALKIVTGGTTGAANGTLVSSGNPLVITALNTPIDAHIRCDDGYWTATETFDVPAELKVSFDGGTTYYGNSDEPITAPEIYAVNYPIKVKQTVAASSTSGSIVTNNSTYTAIAALSTPTLTATRNGTAIDLSWTNVANEDASPGYTIERSTDGGSTYSALTTKAQNVTTHSDTGLSPGTYHYRVKAEGSGRYSDSGWGTANASVLGRIAWTSETLLYQVNEGSGTNIDDKNTTNNNDGTLTLGSGGSWSATGSPFSDPCIDTSVGYIATTFGSNASPSQQTAGTYEFLARFDTPSTNANAQMLFYGDYASFYVQPTSGGLTADPAGVLVFQNALSATPTWNYLAGTTVLASATWYHIACSWDASGKYIHINGVLEASNATNGKNQVTGTMGCNWFGRSTYTPQGVDGRLAMVRVWNSKRSTAQLLAAKQALLG